MFPTFRHVSDHKGPRLCDYSLCKVLGRKVFPNETAQDVWIMIQLFLSLVIFGFSAGYLSRGEATNYDIARLAISSAYALWAIIDAAVRLVCRSCMTTIAYKTNVDNVENGIDSTMRFRDKIRLNCTRFQDIIRLLADIFLYPIFICHVLKHSNSISNFDIFDFNYNRYDGAFFLILIGTYIILVYGARLVVIFSILISVRRALKLRKYRCTYCWFSIRLVLHSFGHIALQIVMIAIISVATSQNEPFNDDEYFWTVVAIAYVLPPFTIVVLFANYYHFLEELIFGIADRQEGRPHNCCLKWLYSFVSPVSIILSMIYATLEGVFFGFIVTGIGDFSSMGDFYILVAEFTFYWGILPEAHLIWGFWIFGIHVIIALALVIGSVLIIICLPCVILYQVCKQ